MRPYFFTLSLVAIILCNWTTTVQAGPILYIHDSSNRLGTVDVGVGVGGVTVIGSMGGDTITDIGFDLTGQLYGVSFTRLYRINALTAAVTLVGSLGGGINGSNALVFGGDGTLYMASNNSTQLYRVNTTTGLATAAGNIGFSAAGDLSFYQGSLYMSSTNDDLIRITLTGGNATGSTNLGSLDHTSVFGLATGDNGVLYGVSGTTVFSVDPSVAGVATTNVRNYAGNGLGQAFGTAFYNEAINAVPVPSGVILAVVGGVFAFGFRSFRRRAVVA